MSLLQSLLYIYNVLGTQKCVIIIGEHLINYFIVIFRRPFSLKTVMWELVYNVRMSVQTTISISHTYAKTKGVPIKAVTVQVGGLDTKYMNDNFQLLFWYIHIMFLLFSTIPMDMNGFMKETLNNLQTTFYVELRRVYYW